MDYRTLGDVIYFYFALNTTAGSGSDATGTPTYQVREGGAASSAAPTLTGNATLLSHASHVDGSYEVAITASSGNGFTADKQYGVFCTAAVSSVNPTGYLGSFILAAVRTDVAAAPSAATIAATVWDYLTSAIVTSNTIGKLLKDNIDVTISSRSSHTAANVRTEIDANSTKLDVAVSTRLASSSYKTPVVTSGQITAVIDSTTYDTNLSFAINGKFSDAVMVITQSGNNQYERRPLVSIDNDVGTGIIYLQEAFPENLQVGDTFEIWGDHVHSIATITGETANAILGDTNNWGSTTIGGIIKTIGTCLSGITSLANWLRIISRKDAGTAGMTTAQTEINTGGTATFDHTTDSLEGNADRVIEATISEAAADAIAAAVVDGIQAIPGFEVSVTSPTDSTGSIEVVQGDAYLEANSRHLSITLTGSLPSLETACKYRVFFGGTVTEYTGTVQVVSATNYRLKCDLTGTQTAAMPVGTFQYEVEVTYLSTTNKWTPSRGKFIVKGQL